MDWLAIACNAIGMFCWYRLGLRLGHDKGYEQGKADKRAQIIEGFERCLREGDLKVYVRKGESPEAMPAKVTIDDIEVGGRVH